MAETISASQFSCSREMKQCVPWVEKYFKDCLCSLSDDISFAFGLVSLICWGVAEIPQIITNFHTKSGHGVSLSFLLTWVAGDIFNLVGCLLEPATLPTQYYTALLYTSTTIVLVLQTVYYDYICRWRRSRASAANKVVEESTEQLKPKKHNSSMPIPTAPRKVSHHKNKYYTSARSLASSGTPTFGSFLRTPRSGPSAVMVEDESSSEDEHFSTYTKPSSQPIRIPRQAGYGTFIVSSLNLPNQSMALTEGLVARKLLQDHVTAGSVYGVWLGWLMAAIYMGGRIPQICLNIKRGSVEGLNPLMFILALIANATYVGSILVRSTDWEKIHPNMPWLLDAVVCVALDLFIILQFIYYSLKQRSKANDQEVYGDSVEAKQSLKP